jgi:hypothetical protein
LIPILYLLQTAGVRESGFRDSWNDAADVSKRADMDQLAEQCRSVVSQWVAPGQAIQSHQHFGNNFSEEVVVRDSAAVQHSIIESRTPGEELSATLQLNSSADKMLNQDFGEQTGFRRTQLIGRHEPEEHRAFVGFDQVMDATHDVVSLTSGRCGAINDTVSAAVVRAFHEQVLTLVLANDGNSRWSTEQREWPGQGKVHQGSPARLAVISETRDQIKWLPINHFKACLSRRRSKRRSCRSSRLRRSSSSLARAADVALISALMALTSLEMDHAQSTAPTNTTDVRKLRNETNQRGMTM